MTTEQKCDVHTEQIDTLKKETRDQWDHINGLEKALSKLVPVWLTIVLTVMGGITGSALTFAGMMIKFAGTK